jgi:RNA polymerase sigma factor (sigma-70 family)
MSDPSEADLLRQLESALANLPQRQRDIFLAKRRDRMRYDEIARRTGLTTDQVRRQMAKALYKLWKQLEGRKLSWWERWF